jgi:hypothetical protein
MMCGWTLRRYLKTPLYWGVFFWYTVCLMKLTVPLKSDAMMVRGWLPAPAKKKQRESDRLRHIREREARQEELRRFPHLVRGKKYAGKPCLICGATLRYVKGNGCVSCRNATSQAQIRRTREARGDLEWFGQSAILPAVKGDSHEST